MPSLTRRSSASLINIPSSKSCLVSRLCSCLTFPDVYVNGKLTQGENIADMGGIKNSYHAFLQKMGKDAFQPSIVPGLNNAQLFFVAYAQGWCEIATAEYLKTQVEVKTMFEKCLQFQTDPHSPAQFRVMGPLINLPQFSDVYQCPQGSTMNPTARCEVW